MADVKPNTDYSEPEYAKSQERAKVPYYRPNIEHRLVSETQELLEKYSHIPPEDQSAHIHKLRDEAWDIRAYPCIGLGSWLTPQLRRLPIYDEILDRVKSHGATLVDVGTFVGHDLRRLAYDGAPSDKLYGVDIVSYADVSYDLFRDRETFKGHFIQADILSDESAELNALKGNVDIIVVSQLLHQWTWDNQVKAAKALVDYTKPGSLIVGNQIGNSKAFELTLKTPPISIWRHNVESFTDMFNKEVGPATGTTWEVQAWLRSFPDMGWDLSDAAWMEPDVCLVEFAARRLS
ncbi:hypothetical protein PFICI_10061 [Pestalotiopsis fici W106-1]|uniref:Methyltransferase domain-containing protein n=1 Tax=Pestalotiopsis fici (strain W106-1 / CGMCC3.15140) TaxID=1229662 RepID=W3WW03_PESFW|nr:uncharacterized protein PFICI_10061 [Pestalotiopsis fici W106-1]ETS77999.1 hypothetical protein PFICI_10061 [Pestalotiopsis fici W106-1]